ncbi:MAG: PorT family protein, partial [Bacteroidetes bacterium]
MKNQRNKITFLKKIFLFLFFCFVNSIIFAQDCKDIVQRAEIAYKKGHLNDVKEILTDECINVLPLKEEKERAYYLLVLSNLYLKDLEAAKVMMLKILHQNPEYVCDPTSPVAFQKFYNSFKSTPFIILGAKIGGNFSQIQSTKIYSLDDFKTSQNGTFQSLPGINMQASAMIPIYKKFELVLEVGFKQYNYSFKNRQFDYSSILFKERQNLIEMPVLAKYNFGNNYNFKIRYKNFWQSLNPYVIAGVSATYLLSSKSTIQREDKLVNSSISINSPEFNTKSMRNAFSFYAVGGVGLDYKKGRAIFSIEGRYHYGFSPIIKSNARYDNQEMLLTYGYVDSDIKFRNLMVTIGYAI